MFNAAACTMAGAANEAAGPAASAPAVVSMPAAGSASTVLSTLVSLVVVLAAIGAVAFLFKRLSPGNASHSRMMRVVSQLSLGAREKISVVEFDDQWLVLGVTPQQITLLAQTARKEGCVPSPQPVNFSRLFQRARGKHDAP